MIRKKHQPARQVTAIMLIVMKAAAKVVIAIPS